MSEGMQTFASVLRNSFDRAPVDLAGRFAFAQTSLPRLDEKLREFAGQDASTDLELGIRHFATSIQVPKQILLSPYLLLISQSSEDWNKLLETVLLCLGKDLVGGALIWELLEDAVERRLLSETERVPSS